MKKLSLLVCLFFFSAGLHSQTPFFEGDKKYEFDLELEHGYLNFKVVERWDQVWEKKFPCGDAFLGETVSYKKWTLERDQINGFLDLVKNADCKYLEKMLGLAPGEGINIGDVNRSEELQDELFKYFSIMGYEKEGLPITSSLFFFYKGDTFFREFSFTDFIEPGRNGFISYPFGEYEYQFSIFQFVREYDITYHPSSRESFNFLTQQDKDRYLRLVKKTLESHWGLDAERLRKEVFGRMYFPLSKFWYFDFSDYEGWVPNDQLVKWLEDDEEDLVMIWPDEPKYKEQKVFEFTTYGELYLYDSPIFPCCEQKIVPLLEGPVIEIPGAESPAPQPRQIEPGRFRFGGNADTLGPWEQDDEQGMLVPDDQEEGELACVSFSATSNDIPTGPIGTYEIVLYTPDIHALPDEITLEIAPTYLHAVDDSQPNAGKRTCVTVPLKTTPIPNTGEPAPMLITVEVPFEGICVGTPDQHTVPLGQPWSKVTFSPAPKTVQTIQDTPENERTQEQKEQLTAYQVDVFLNTVEVTQQQLIQEGVITSQLEGYATSDELLTQQWLWWDVQDDLDGPFGTWSEPVSIEEKFDSIFVADVEEAAGVPYESLPAEYQEVFEGEKQTFITNISSIKERMRLTKEGGPGEAILIDDDTPVPQGNPEGDDPPRVECEEPGSDYLKMLRTLQEKDPEKYQKYLEFREKLYRDGLTVQERQEFADLFPIENEMLLFDDDNGFEEKHFDWKDAQGNPIQSKTGHSYSTSMQLYLSTGDIEKAEEKRFKNWGRAQESRLSKAREILEELQRQREVREQAEREAHNGNFHDVCECFRLDVNVKLKNGQDDYLSPGIGLNDPLFSHHNWNADRRYLNPQTPFQIPRDQWRAIGGRALGLVGPQKMGVIIDNSGRMVEEDCCYYSRTTYQDTKGRDRVSHNVQIRISLPPGSSYNGPWDEETIAGIKYRFPSYPLPCPTGPGFKYSGPWEQVTVYYSLSWYAGVFSYATPLGEKGRSPLRKNDWVYEETGVIQSGTCVIRRQPRGVHNGLGRIEVVIDGKKCPEKTIYFELK